MDFLNPREPVSTWSHGLWLLLVLPGSVLLWRRSRGDRGKQLSLLIYGLSLVFCATASTLYHAARSAESRIATFALLDYLGIYFLIAGTYTAIAWNLLRGRWRRGILALVWAWAIGGWAIRLSFTSLPPWLSTGLYLLMGWGSVFCYVEVARRLSHRALLPIVAGGVFYSLGAFINLLHQPVLWPGVFGRRAVPRVRAGRQPGPLLVRAHGRHPVRVRARDLLNTGAGFREHRNDFGPQRTNRVTLVTPSPRPKRPQPEMFRVFGATRVVAVGGSSHGMVGQVDTCPARSERGRSDFRDRPAFNFRKGLFLRHFLIPRKHAHYWISRENGCTHHGVPDLA